MSDVQYHDEKWLKGEIRKIWLGSYKWPDEPIFVVFPKKCIVAKKYYWFTKMKKGFSTFDGRDVYMHPKNFVIAKLKGWL